MLGRDLYQQSPKLYLFGLLMMIFFMLFVFISLYITPFLVWGLHYDVPEVVIGWEHYLHEDLELSAVAAKWITFLSFSIPGLVCLIVSWIISIYVDNTIAEETELDETELSSDEKELKNKPDKSVRLRQNLSFASKIIILMLVALGILFTVEWLITAAPPAR